VDENSPAAMCVVDAAAFVVARGFIDPRTHCDAQICWDARLSPLSWHGVTTVVMDNRGLGIVPSRLAARGNDR
jgi:N-acyl-D-aspartate/D-glutamate deacylase